MYPEVRLVKNNEGETPWDLIRNYPKKTMLKRGANCRRLVWDYFEALNEERPWLEDPQEVPNICNLIMRG
jgi:hypothetical protein